MDPGTIYLFDILISETKIQTKLKFCALDSEDNSRLTFSDYDDGNNSNAGEIRGIYCKTIMGNGERKQNKYLFKDFFDDQCAATRRKERRSRATGGCKISSSASGLTHFMIFTQQL